MHSCHDIFIKPHPEIPCVVPYLPAIPQELSSHSVKRIMKSVSVWMGNRKCELVFLGTSASTGKKRDIFHLHQQKQKDPLPGLDAHPRTQSSWLNNGLQWEPDEPTLELSYQSAAGREMNLYSAHWCLRAEPWPCSSNHLPPQQPGCSMAHVSFLLLLDFSDRASLFSVPSNTICCN